MSSLERYRRSIWYKIGFNNWRIILLYHCEAIPAHKNKYAKHDELKKVTWTPSLYYFTKKAFVFFHCIRTETTQTDARLITIISAKTTVTHGTVILSFSLLFDMWKAFIRNFQFQTMHKTFLSLYLYRELSPSFCVSGFVCAIW